MRNYSYYKNNNPCFYIDDANYQGDYYLSVYNKAGIEWVHKNTFEVIIPQ